MRAGYLACIAALLSLLAVDAQADVEGQIAHCAQFSPAADRIQCLENALRGKTDRDDNASVLATPEPQAAAPKSAPPAPLPEVATPRETDEAPSPAPLPERAPDAVRPAVAAQDRTSEVEVFGLEESQREVKRLDSIDVLVTAIDRNAYGKLIYVTDNDQAWQQIDQRRPRYPDLPFPAEIRRGAAGSFFIQPLDGGIAIRVKRRN